MAVALVALFGGLALLLASIGLYGVMSYTVSQSTRELGLRMALGAGTSNVLRLVLFRGLLLTTTGIIIGVALALLLTRLLGTLLYRVSPRDPLAFAAAFAVMTLASTAACFLPAWRATRTDPMRALSGGMILLFSLLFCFAFSGQRNVITWASDAHLHVPEQPEF